MNFLKVNRDTDYLSIENTVCLKGIFSMFVLMHHLYCLSLSCGTVINTRFEFMGYLSVAVFFFCTGYGLMGSYISKGKAYIRTFPKNRILQFYCTYLLFTALYLVMYSLLGDKITLTSVAQALIIPNKDDSQTILYGWYLQAALILYIAFYFVFLMVSRYRYQLIGFTLALLAYCVLCIWLGLSPTWYQSVFAVLLGMLWHKCGSIVDAKTKKYKLGYVVFLFIVFCCTLLLGRRSLPETIFIPIRMFSALIFVLLVLALIRIIPIRCKLTYWLGEHSLELYALQGVPIVIFKRAFPIDNPIVYSLVVILCTIILAAIAHPVVKKITGAIKKIG